MSEQLLKEILGELKALNQRVGNIEQRVGNMEQRIGDLEQGQQELVKRVGDLELLIVNRIDPLCANKIDPLQNKNNQH